MGRQKGIETLIVDIYELLKTGKEISNESAERFGHTLAKLVQEKMKPKPPEPGTLRLSSIGAPDRKLWYQYNQPEKAESIEPKVLLKFLTGDIFEATLLFLAEEAGHKVELQQEEVEVGGVKGHPDAVIDGHLVDVKTASSFAMRKFAEHKVKEDDPFHYFMQLSSYHASLKNRPEVEDKSRASFLAADKNDGTLVLDTYQVDRIDVEAIVHEKKEMVKGAIPERCHTDVPDGKSGNMKLGTECSYCVFKRHCWDGLTAWNYSGSPRYLTKVVRKPDVEQIF